MCLDLGYWTADKSVTQRTASLRQGFDPAGWAPMRANRRVPQRITNPSPLAGEVRRGGYPTDFSKNPLSVVLYGNAFQKNVFLLDMCSHSGSLRSGP